LLPEPFAPFLDYLTFGILPEHVLSGLTLEEMIDHPFNLAPVGTGPFSFQRLLVENDQIVGVVLEAFDGYFLDRPYLDEFIFRYYPNSEEALAAYQSGEVEGIGDVDDSILQEVLKEPDLAIYTTREPLLTMVYLNLDNPEVGFLQNPDFRRAMMTSINRNLMIENIYGGQAVLANGPIIPGTWAYYNDLDKIDYDMIEAKKFFEAADVSYDEDGEVFLYEDELEVAITLLHPDTQEHTAIAQQLKSDWEALGMSVELEAKPYDEVLSDLETRAYQTALVDINLTNSPDPDPYPFWGQAQMQSGQNYAEWDNRSASEFLEQARMTVDMSERERLYRNFQVIFMQELPSLPLFYPVYTYAITEDIKGVNMGPVFNPGDRFNNVNLWYILSGRDITITQTVEEPTEVEE
jgi:peptide/nickel transport system substrate-binding protein